MSACITVFGYLNVCVQDWIDIFRFGKKVLDDKENVEKYKVKISK